MTFSDQLIREKNDDKDHHCGLNRTMVTLKQNGELRVLVLLYG